MHINYLLQAEAGKHLSRVELALIGRRLLNFSSASKAPTLPKDTTLMSILNN